MRKISDTIARLSAFKARHAASPGGLGAPDRLSALNGFGFNPGALKAKFYLPEHMQEKAPLVVVLHGCTQKASGYDHHSGWSKLADEAGFALLYPEQQPNNNPNLCFNWFHPADIGRNSGEALSIHQMIETMVATHGLDRKRVFVTGLSAGGAMASAMLASYPDVFAGGAIIAGLAFGSATTVPEAFDRMRGHGGPSDEDMRRLLRDASRHTGPWPRISIWHGTGDQTVAASNAHSVAGQWQGVHETKREYTLIDGRNARQVWCDANGTDVIELNMISGMGHGTPIDVGRLGVPGPYMLDVGISSTLEIARFWGIADTGKTASAGTRRDRAVSTVDAIGSRPVAGALKPTARPSEPSATWREREAPPASGVQKVIEDALRAAGLMR